MVFKGKWPPTGKWFYWTCHPPPFFEFVSFLGFLVSPDFYLSYHSLVFFYDFSSSLRFSPDSIPSACPLPFRLQLPLTCQWFSHVHHWSWVLTRHPGSSTQMSGYLYLDENKSAIFSSNHVLLTFCKVTSS